MDKGKEIKEQYGDIITIKCKGISLGWTSSQKILDRIRLVGGNTYTKYRDKKKMNYKVGKKTYKVYIYPQPDHNIIFK